ncbi:MAG: beta-galactosidase [Candidatus Bathyarchaeia archaeon]
MKCIGKEYFKSPIVGAYLHILPMIKSREEIDKYLHAIKNANATCIWAFVGGVDVTLLKYFMDKAYEMGLKVTPVLQPFVSISEHPEVKIVNADGTTSDDPRYSNIGCFNHPYLFEVSKKLVKDFLENFKDHPALYRIGGAPLVSFVHEAYYRNDVPEFGGGPLKPCCYCKYCVEDFKARMKEKYGNVESFNAKHKTGIKSWDDLEPPKDKSNASLWKKWFDYHAEIIPNFLERLIKYARSITPVLATHELNDFYPCTYQCVYSGNDIWRMARVIDIGHEDMYPLEFDHRYVIYIFEYIKDIVRSAMGFNRLYTGNGQSFDSWLGYKIPVASMFEQVYSTLAHGALGIVWWVDWRNLELWAQTSQPNSEYARLVSALRSYELTRAEVALLYPWTTMQLKTDDNYPMDNLLFYTALVRSGFPVDVISEDQIVNGVLENRRYKVLCTIGNSTLPIGVVQEIKEFVREGGTLIADYEGVSIDEFASAYPNLVNQTSEEHVIYKIETKIPSLSGMNGTIIPVENTCEELNVPCNAEVIAKYEDGKPAIIKFPDGRGRVIKAGSFLGWDYSNYPGHYDFAVMFPFLIKRNEKVRELISGLLKDSGVHPPAESSNPNVEVAVWRGKGCFIVLAVNHLNEKLKATLKVRVDIAEQYEVKDFFTRTIINSEKHGNMIAFKIELSGFQGKPYLIEGDINGGI